ncbi:SDR family oxidoreductase [Portibacter lacus]|uniref:Oxidoreductase n=1 Tax=Portibacter lacus TaxID=1099794 RepID=A0AA37WGA2_9BACT|nr:SDR family oxidoreductase [Portibacter lacus]GLR19633.1 oxidoreductase [Portibacter lacus]
MGIKYFQDKTIWITGASSGIGEGFARALSEAGAYVILSSRREKVLQEIQSQLAFPNRSKVVTIDMEDNNSIDAACEMINNEFQIDMVILNAGISQRSRILDTEFQTEQRIMQTNFIGAARLTKLILPKMVEKQKGHFVVLSSVTGKIGVPTRSMYSASKHALHGYFDSLRAELTDSGIFVTILCPGYVYTNISKNAVLGDGAPQNSIDENSKNGMLVDTFVEKALKGIAKKKQEMLIGGKETMGVVIKRFFPSLLNNIIKKVNA